MQSSCLDESNNSALGSHNLEGLRFATRTLFSSVTKKLFFLKKFTQSVRLFFPPLHEASVLLTLDRVGVRMRVCAHTSPPNTLACTCEQMRARHGWGGGGTKGDLLLLLLPPPRWLATANKNANGR